MTVAGPSGKTALRRGLAALGAVLLTIAQPSRNMAATTERIVTDLYSGVAISGYDPVAYFTDRAPQLGRRDFEVVLDGVAWRFVNAGNRAAFVNAPEVYKPHFGGYDPIGIARGAAAAGHPHLWLVFEDRLYLFFSERAREQFAADPVAAGAAAESRWAAVKKLLAD